MIDSTFDLFVDLGANDEQCDFPVVYASGANGVAGGSPEELAEDLAPLFEAIVREARPTLTPKPFRTRPTCMRVGVEVGRTKSTGGRVSRALEDRRRCKGECGRSARCYAPGTPLGFQKQRTSRRWFESQSSGCLWLRASCTALTGLPR